LRTLRCVVVGGEACPPELLARHRALLPDCLFENNYGPTEVAVWAMANVIRPDSAALPAAARTVPIGRPVDGLRCHVLDESLRPVPAGEPGELYFSGAAVARGYHRRPQLTAERFIPSPFAADPGARMYRTGDIARALPDGTIEFVGRRDAQVKVRGHRVELGEVEAALNRHPDVAEAAVDVRVYAGEPVLVAYIRPRSRPGLRRLDVALRAHLSPLLPASMLPSRYVHMEVLPRTVSGKIDRAVLPDPRPDGDAPANAVPKDAAR
jgi:acyl-coenzyme A synthetase/AMP-(fatty) acid ligase